MLINNVMPNRYHSVAILLHWLMALGLIFMFASGIYMVYGDITKAEQYKLFQIHKASGVIMLWAIMARILVRILVTSPAPSQSISSSNAKKAKIGHVMLYGALVLMPLSGWVMVSASPFGLPTFVFVDWIEWPHIPGLARNKTVETAANNVHWISAIVLILLVFGHVAAVLVHKRVHKVNLLTRMWWKNAKN
ncbi:cytochrome b [Glaciecola petra]|uniref:Cytochrome b n=1 Tax=Glaciecola petra TaxID=3075602 RepID=A0ABU2ZTF2_9ALTE|nr:cytochrome b [Aestuariibacter sp. P117]MDT0595885.1 cytochrome b [Aestuariibacter sp. P117]